MAGVPLEFVGTQHGVVMSLGFISYRRNQHNLMVRSASRRQVYVAGVNLPAWPLLRMRVSLAP
jgi:hypothetical protein